MDEQPDIEFINDIYQHSFTFRFRGLNTLVVDPNRWDAGSDGLLSDVRAATRKALGRLQLTLAKLAVEEQHRYDALEEDIKQALPRGAFYDDELAAQREQAQRELTATVTGQQIALLLPLLQPDNPELTAEALARLRAVDLWKVINFFEQPELALQAHQREQAERGLATPATTPASPAALAATPVRTADAA